MDKVNVDDLDDEQVEIYEAGYIAGQIAIAARLHQLAREYEMFAPVDLDKAI